MEQKDKQKRLPTVVSPEWWRTVPAILLLLTLPRSWVLLWFTAKHLQTGLCDLTVPLVLLLFIADDVISRLGGGVMLTPPPTPISSAVSHRSAFTAQSAVDNNPKTSWQHSGNVLISLLRRQRQEPFWLQPWALSTQLIKSPEHLNNCSARCLQFCLGCWTYQLSNALAK